MTLNQLVMKLQFLYTNTLYLSGAKLPIPFCYLYILE